MTKIFQGKNIPYKMKRSYDQSRGIDEVTKHFNKPKKEVDDYLLKLFVSQNDEKYEEYIKQGLIEKDALQKFIYDNECVKSFMNELEQPESFFDSHIFYKEELDYKVLQLKYIFYRKLNLHPFHSNILYD